MRQVDLFDYTRGAIPEYYPVHTCGKVGVPLVRESGCLLTKEGFTPESSSKALYYARALSNFKVIVVTKVISDKDLKEMFFTPIPDIQQAIEESMKIMGQDAEFIFIPHGSDIIPELESWGCINFKVED